MIDTIATRSQCECDRSDRIDCIATIARLYLWDPAKSNVLDFEHVSVISAALQPITDEIICIFISHIHVDD